jgi:hypothetical protein
VDATTQTLFCTADYETASAIASSMTLIAREAQKLLSTFGLAHVARGFQL